MIRLRPWMEEHGFFKEKGEYSHFKAILFMAMAKQEMEHYSLRQLADIWGWSRTRVMRFQAANQAEAEKVLRDWEQINPAEPHGAEYDVSPNTPRAGGIAELRFFEKFCPPIRRSMAWSDVHQQRIVGKYYIDCLLVKDIINEATRRKFVIIEYDESYHEQQQQCQIDVIRERDLASKLISENMAFDSINVEIIRIKQEQEAAAFQFVLPYLTNVSKDAKEWAIKSGIDWRTLYDK